MLVVKCSNNILVLNTFLFFEKKLSVVKFHFSI